MGYYMDATQDFRIRTANKNDLFQLTVLCYNFVKEAPDIFLSFDKDKVEHILEAIVDSDIGEIFILEKNNIPCGLLIGAISELPFSRKRIANELAWFVEKEHRGGTKALRLIKAYEKWAREGGADIISMSNLNEVQDLGSLYYRLGYKATETSYTKVA